MTTDVLAALAFAIFVAANVVALALLRGGRDESLVPRMSKGSTLKAAADTRGVTR